MALGLLQEFNDWVFVVSESGSNKEYYKFSDFEIYIENASTHLGLHALTGHDYLPSFFRKGKEKRGNFRKKSQKFEGTFGKLGKEEN